MKKADYLRVSITDKCNLNCLYCNPKHRERFLDKGEILSFEEITRAVRLFVFKGIKKVRITGGEPLLRKGITGFVKMLKQIKGLDEISMTTNGIMLKEMAAGLKQAGLNRVNISLDTLKEKKFREITGSADFNRVWAGINEAMKVFPGPVKLNVIIMEGLNEDEIADFAGLTMDFPLVVRFIEYFPTNRRVQGIKTVTSAEIKEKIKSSFGGARRVFNITGNGPAEYYKINNSLGSLGFISSFTKDFCKACNRIRLDSFGRVFPCLFSSTVYDIKQLLKRGLKEKEVFEIVEKILKMKSGQNKKDNNKQQVEMSRIGG